MRKNQLITDTRNWITMKPLSIVWLKGIKVIRDIMEN